MDRNLIEYLPPVLQDYKELKAIMYTEQPEFEFIWDAKDLALINMFIIEANEYGIARWEKILGIAATQKDNLEQRRTRILARINEKLPYSVRVLHRLMKEICGDAGTISVDHAQKKISASVKNADRGTYMDVREMLERVVPVNMLIDVLAEQTLPELTVSAYVKQSTILRKIVIGDILENLEYLPNKNIKIETQNKSIRRIVVGDILENLECLPTVNLKIKLQNQHIRKVVIGGV